ncbi:MAG: hypothetical protein ABL889_22370, partial [Terricaulis sp.]
TRSTRTKAIGVGSLRKTGVSGSDDASMSSTDLPPICSDIRTFVPSLDHVINRPENRQAPLGKYRHADSMSPS